MKQNIVYIGIDVDDTRYHGCALNQHTGEILDFHCRPTLKGLVVAYPVLGDCTMNIAWYKRLHEFLRSTIFTTDLQPVAVR